MTNIGPRTSVSSLMTESTESPTRRRGRGLSLRALMAVVLVVGGGLGYTVHRANLQRDVIASLKAGGAYVGYDWEWDGDRPLYKSRPWAPDWLIKRVGIDYFGHVYSVGLTEGTDALLADVARLSRLAHLNTFGLGITDAGLAQLARLPGLDSLTLSETSVTDAGLARLRGLTRLRHLGLQSARITDAGLDNLSGMARLENLTLNSTKIGDAGLERLKALPSLTELGLENTEVSDAGLVHLKGMRRLKKVWLMSTKVTEAGAEGLRRARPDIEVEWLP